MLHRWWYVLWATPVLAAWPGSQGNQDTILQDLFYSKIGTTNRFAVEFGGCPGALNSNTLLLRSANTSRIYRHLKDEYRPLHTPWQALLMEGDPSCVPTKAWRKSHANQSFVVARISSANIVSLFEEHGVPDDPDYVSIDLDTIDLWVLRAILSSSRFRPRVITIEYNSNFGDEMAITMPDPLTMDATPWNFTDEHLWHKGTSRAYYGSLCFQGASARAISLVADEFGYAIVNRTLGLDLFLVRRDVWRERVPTLAELRLTHCMNLPMTTAMAANLLDYRVLHGHLGARHGEGSTRRLRRHLVCEANRRAQAALRRLATERGGLCARQCFKHLASEPMVEPAACRAEEEVAHGWDTMAAIQAQHEALQEQNQERRRQEREQAKKARASAAAS